MDKKKTIEEYEEYTDKKEIELNAEINKLDKKIGFFRFCAWGFVVIGLLIGLWAICFFSKNHPAKDFNVLGDFMAGSVSALWSLAGLFFIYVAFLGQKQQMLYQQKEIMLNQLELRYTREEVKGQKKALEEQNITMQYQRFENTFFQLLANHNEIVDSIERKQFSSFYLDLKSQSNGKSLEEITSEVYPKVLTKRIVLFGHYFRNLYHIIRFVDDSEIKDKRRYTNFVRAKLNSFELILLFYNCLSLYGIDKFKPLVQTYSLLKNIENEGLFSLDHKEAYHPNAFASSETYDYSIENRDKLSLVSDKTI